MEKNPFIILSNSPANEQLTVAPTAKNKARRLEAQAYFDRLWLIDPEQFNPLRNCMHRERIDRTMQLIEKMGELQNKRVVDLGCGSGVLSRRIRDEGASVDAVDVSENALKKLREFSLERIQPCQDYVPSTLLNDDAYDLVVCTELIAYVRSDEYRLLFSELIRLVKREGYIICSASIDIDSDDALARFAEFAETETEILQWSLSYHRCYIRIKSFFETPSRFIKASRDGEWKTRELKKRGSLSSWWLRINSTPPLVWLWYPISLLFYPFMALLKNNRTVLLLLEKFCHALWQENGVSQAIFIGKRRKLFQELPKDQIPKEHKQKRQVWE